LQQYNDGVLEETNGNNRWQLGVDPDQVTSSKSARKYSDKVWSTRASCQYTYQIHKQ
jgi:hypothetical protein